MLKHVQNFLRLCRVSIVLARYNALFPLYYLPIPPLLFTPLRLLSWGNQAKGRPGERLSRALQTLGPSFIKLGQALSTRADLISEEIAADLSELRDNLPPFPTAKAREIIEKDFGRPVEALFDNFESAPVAAASIAQVHYASADGRELAVKILRPDIASLFARDLELFSWLAALANRALPATKRLKLVEVVENFAELVNHEMDFRMEAAAASELRENFANDPGFIVPEIDWQRTSTRVLTMQRLSGIAINDRAALVATKLDPTQILKRAGEIFFKQVFRDGFFHGDMHPGNVFIDKQGNILAVDFGIMGRIDQPTRIYLAEMLQGFLNRDYKKVADVHFAAGWVPADQSRELFAQACRGIAEPIFGLPQHEISLARLLGQLFKVTEDFNMHTQIPLLLLQKTMMMAEGIGRALNPSVNMWQLAGPIVETWAAEYLGPKARIQNEIKELTRLKERALRLLENMEHTYTPEGLRLHPDTIAALKD